MLAFEALGFGTGAAADAAQLVAWCDVHGFAGAPMLAAKLPLLRAEEMARPPFRIEEASGPAIDALGNSLLGIGPAAVEYGYAEHEEGRLERLNLKHVRDLEFAPGLAGLAAQRGIDVMLTCSSQGQSMIALCNGTTGEVEIRLMPIPPGDPIAADELGAVFGWKPGVRREAVSYGARVLTPDSLRRIAESSLIDGVLMDAAVWEAVLRTAKKRLVPESERSRERGAGIGANDEG